MDSFEMTKIAGAVLSALLLIVGTKTFIESTSHHKLAKPGYVLPAATAPADGAGAEASAEGAAPAGDIGPDAVALLGKANAENGKAVFAKCKSCHTADKGKPNGVGPNLFGVVNRPKAKVEGFKYSDAMVAKTGEWTFENLSHFLANPKAYVAGTKMVFKGIPAAAERADLIAYLASMADIPVALPK